MVKINPFSVGYKKQEDKITALLNHVLEECNLINSFLTYFLEEDFMNCDFDLDLQLHNKFKKPVKKAILIGISNLEELQVISSSKEDGNPDAYYYDTKNKILVLVETKIGIGRLTSDQMKRHKRKLGSNINWKDKVIYWDDVVSFFNNIYQTTNSEVQKYIIRNFIGALNQDVLGHFDEEYYCHLAGNNSTLVKNILFFIEEHFKGYRQELFNKTHNELRFFSHKKDRFFTIILNHNRVILHYNGDKGFKLREELNERYGVFYPQTNKKGSTEIYTNELSIPFKCINKDTLKIEPEFVHEFSVKNDILDLLDLKELIKHSLRENFNLRRAIIYND
jgi:hypothetical protein